MWDTSVWGVFFLYKFLKQVWYFARLIVLWRSAEGTSAWKSSNKFGISLA